MLLLLGTAGFAAAAWAAFEALYRARDVETVHLDTARRTPWVEAPGPGGCRTFTCQLPFTNRSQAYEQTLVDVTAAVRVLAKGEVGPDDIAASVSVRSLSDDGRGDGYWAAHLVKEQKQSLLELVVSLRTAPDVRLHAAVVSVAYATYGRRTLAPWEVEVVLPLSAVKPLPAPAIGQTVTIQCVPTHVLTDVDDIVDVIDRYTRDFRQNGDIVAVAESVVAITQGQYFRPRDVKLGYLAKRLCYFIPSKGSLSSPYGFQVAMNQIGRLRMVTSLVAGALGKLVGRHGVFYELAGRPAELIDDVTGTMPPFDKYIVAGPRDPEGVVARIRERTGMEAAIVDANDLKRALVLACTPGADPQEVSRMLLDNPFGNAAEQTPVVVLRPHAATGKGSSQRDQSYSL